MTQTIEPGDVVGVRTTDFAGLMIRLGAALLDKPNLINHIAVAHHRDANGTLWGIEGRPGGVGWVDMTAYLKSPYLVNNALQPKTDAQRKIICDTMQHLLGTPYDWVAIGMDAMDAMRLEALWKPEEHQGVMQVPGHVVCSSAAVYVYDMAKLAVPPGLWRIVTPANWDEFCIVNKYSASV